MEASATPGFTDIFGEERPDFGKLLEDIPSRMIIVFCAIVNAELINDDESRQEDILKFVTRRFPVELKEHIFSKIEGTKRGRVTLFATRYTIEFIHRALFAFRDFEFNDTTPQQEIKIFMAYLMVVEDVNKTFSLENNEDKTEIDVRIYFRKLSWPLVFNQIEYNNVISAKFELIKWLTFLKYLDENSFFKKHIDEYLTDRGFTSIKDYVLNFVNILWASFRKENATGAFSEFQFIKSDNKSTFLKTLAINPNDYMKQSNLHLNYKGLKEAPLFEYSEDLFVPFSKGLLFNKIFNGFVFDFFYKTSLNQSKEYSSFDVFKSKYSKQFSEQIIFKTLIHKIFEKKYSEIHFDDNDSDKAPDCYIRQGKKIYILEFKDYFVNDKLVTYGKYDDFVSEIDKKFVENETGKSKGIVQLLNHIKQIELGGFEFDDFMKKGFKIKNVEIYPIIVHTNSAFTVVDINDYLNEKFQERLKCDLKIKPLTLINIESIYYFYEQLRKSKLKLNDLIDEYWSIKKGRIRKFQKEFTGIEYLKAYASFEDIMKEKKYFNENRMHDNETHEMFTIFGIRDFLTKVA